MVDSFNNPELAPEAAVQEKPARTGFLSTTLGKLVVGGIALVVILGIIGFIVAYFFLSSGTEDMVGGIVVSPPPGTESTATPDAEPVEPDVPDLDETFTFRNIFAPTVKVVTSSGSSSGSTTDSQTPPSDLPANTLFLMEISVVDGVETARFVLNGTEYLANEGDQLGDTPWRVVSIDENSVTMLYGDTRVVVALGQGVTK